MAKEENLSHEEIWDDSALIDSWNEALEEYKYYHSLHARGEKVEDVLRRYEEEEYDGAAEVGPAAGVGGEQTYSRTHININDSIEEKVNQIASSSRQNAAAPSQVHVQNGVTNAAPVGSAGMPQMLLSSGKDEALKNLMMSWYYAGYYTGFYEGQQSGRQELLDASKATKKG